MNIVKVLVVLNLVKNWLLIVIFFILSRCFIYFLDYFRFKVGLDLNVLTAIFSQWKSVQ